MPKKPMTPQEMGRKGGKRRVKKLTKEELSDQMKKLAKKRWAGGRGRPKK